MAHPRTDSETIVLLHAIMQTEEWGGDLMAGMNMFLQEQVNRISTTDYANMLSAHHSEYCDGCVCPACEAGTVISIDSDDTSTGAWQCGRCGYSSEDADG